MGSGLLADHADSVVVGSNRVAMSEGTKRKAK